MLLSAGLALRLESLCVEKNLVTCRELPVRRAKHDSRYAALSSAFRSAQHVLDNPPSEQQLASAKKKLMGVGVAVMSMGILLVQKRR